MYMKAQNAISGKEGSLIFSNNGKVRVVAECKNITANLDKSKAEFRALGYRGTQHKATGWSGSGTLTIHYASSEWVKQMLTYVKTGVDTYFSLLVTNLDPTSLIGSQRVLLTDCNLDSIEIAKLDVDADFLDQAMNFTFSGVDLLDGFTDNLTDANTASQITSTVL